MRNHQVKQFLRYNKYKLLEIDQFRLLNCEYNKKSLVKFPNAEYLKLKYDFGFDGYNRVVQSWRIFEPLVSDTGQDYQIEEKMITTDNYNSDNYIVIGKFTAEGKLEGP